MKKISLLIVAVLLAVQSALVSGCSEKNDAAKDQRLSGAEAQWAEGITLEDYLEKVPYIFTGVCTEVRTGKPSGEVSLSVGKVIRGSGCEGTVILRGLSESAFSAGREYLVFAGRSTSVFLGYDYYAVETIICDAGTGVYEGSISGNTRNFAESCSYAEKYIKDHPYTGSDELAHDYCRSDDVLDVYDFSTDVFIGKITGIALNVTGFSTTYTVECKKRLKGGGSGNVLVTAFKDSLTEGSEYLFLLTGEENGTAFVVSSKRSVFPTDSEEYVRITSLAS